MKRWALVALAVSTAAGAGAGSGFDPRAQRVLALARNTQATYAVFGWNVITPPGASGYEEWSAEFHFGTHHRVEVPRYRIVADCAAMIGTRLDAVTGIMDRSQAVARVACGVADAAPLAGVRYLGKETGRFGPVQKIEVTDSGTVRGYQIDRRGIIVGQTIRNRDGHMVVRARAQEIRLWVPADAFSDESLGRSLVPARFKEPPRVPNGSEDSQGT